MSALAVFETPRQTRRAETATRLLDAAWAIARAEGVAALSLHELGRRLGIRQPSLYTYFDSKHGLYNLMTLMSARELSARSHAVEVSGEPIADLRALVHVLVDFAVEDVARTDLLLRNGVPGFSPSPAATEPLEEFWALLATRLQAAGITGPLDVDVAMASINGVIDAYLRKDASRTRINAATDRLLHALRVGLAAPNGPTRSLVRMPTYVALLRAVNVGSGRKVAMSDLRDVFTALGHTDVVTYVQSGNVVFRAKAGNAGSVRSGIERRITKDLGQQVSVILRTPAQLRKIVDGYPFEAKLDPAKVGVAFLRDAAPAAKVRALDPTKYEPERFVVKRSDVYLAYPNGFGRAKLTNAVLEKQLGTVATTRNWKTVRKLLELSS